MPIFGLFRRNRLENLKIQEVRDEQREQERLEQEIVRRIYRKQDRMESLRIYVRDERSISDMELDNIANELEEIEIDVAADNQELNRVRQGEASRQGHPDSLGKEGQASARRRMAANQQDGLERDRGQPPQPRRHGQRRSLQRRADTGRARGASQPQRHPPRHHPTPPPDSRRPQGKPGRVGRRVGLVPSIISKPQAR